MQCTSAATTTVSHLPTLEEGVTVGRRLGRRVADVARRRARAAEAGLCQLLLRGFLPTRLTGWSRGDRLAGHVCSGAGQVDLLRPGRARTGRGLAFVARFDEAVEDLQTAVEVCLANGAVGYLAEAQYELASTLLRPRRPGDIGRAWSLLTSSSRRATVLGMRVIVD